MLPIIALAFSSFVLFVNSFILYKIISTTIEKEDKVNRDFNELARK